MRLLPVLLVAGLVGPVLAAVQPQVTLHVKLLSVGHLHVADAPGGGLRSISVTGGSEVSVTAGCPNDAASSDDLAVTLPADQTGSLTITDNSPDAHWFSDYCHKLHHVPATTIFSEVGTGIQVTPHVEGAGVVLTITPFLHYDAPNGTGTVIFKEVSTKLQSSSGGTVVLSPQTARGKAVYRYIFGGATQSPSYLQFFRKS